MNDIELNPLNENIRKLLQFGVVLAVILFLFIFFFLKDKEEQLVQKTVYLQDNVLYVFDQNIAFNGFPEKISIHNPYLVLTKSEIQKSYIYNLKTKKHEKTIDKVVLDYFNGQILYNKGSVTIFNKKTLNTFCEKGIIKSKDEILCLPAGEQNKILLISLVGKENKVIYKTQNAITEIALIDNKIYVGEINMTNNKNYLSVDNKLLEVMDIVSVIYKMDNNIYIGSFRSPLNKNIDSYHKIEKNKVTKEAERRIVFK